MSLGSGIHRSSSARFFLRNRQRVAREGERFDDASADEMFLDDSLEHLGRAGVIPDAFGINDRDRPARADAEAVGFRAIDQRLGSRELQFLEPLLQKFPRRK